MKDRWHLLNYQFENAAHNLTIEAPEEYFGSVKLFIDKHNK